MSRPRLLFWALVLATGAVYLAMVLWSLPRITEATGGLMPFDLRPSGYDLAEAQAFLAALDPATTRFYLDVQQSLDLVFPGLLGATLILAFIALAPARLKLPLALIVTVETLSDWTENLLVARMLDAGPEGLDPDLVGWASAATVTKSALSTLAFLALIMLLLRRYLLRRGRPHG